MREFVGVIPNVMLEIMLKPAQPRTLCGYVQIPHNLVFVPSMEIPKTKAKEPVVIG